MKKHKLTDILSFHKTPLALAMLTALPGAAVPEAFANGPPPNPAGPEFRVNITTVDRQTAPAMAMDANGNFVVVWQSNGQDGDGYGIFAQRYNATGIPQESGNPPTKFEFPVNTTIDDDQKAPAVAMDANGNFVVAWQGPQIASDIHARRYDKNGNALDTSEFPVNTTTIGRQWYPAVAMDAAGNFVVAWQSQGQDGSGWGIYAQRYDKTGARKDTEFRVNTTTQRDQINPAVTMDAAGNFVVVWLNEVDSLSYRIDAQFYNAEGKSQGPELQVTVPFIGSSRPAVAMDAAGNFVVAWVPSSLSDIIYARRYTIINGAPQAQRLEFPVSTSNGQSPAVAMDTSGNFVVTWLKLLDGGGSWDSYARRYDKNENAIDTPEFRVNTYSADNDYEWHATAVAMDTAGDFVIVWQSFDGNDKGIAGQRYALNNYNTAVYPPTISNKHTETTPVTEGHEGTFSFTATFCNYNNSAFPLTGLVSRTVTLTNNNCLLNRHYGPQGKPSGDGFSPCGVGSVLDFPANNPLPNNGYNDYALAVGECVDVTYLIGLQQLKRFSFFVNVEGM